MTLSRPAYDRARVLIGALNKEGAPRVVHGALQAALIAEANVIDAVSSSETHPGREWDHARRT